MTTKTTEELFNEFEDLLDRYGKDSKEVRDFLKKHVDNEEFRGLADIALSMDGALDGIEIDWS